MKLIVGLGNPGEKYKQNRHNVGFLFVDYILHNLTAQPQQSVHNNFQNSEQFRAETASLTINDDKILIIKPQTFMNRSGESVSRAMAFYKIHLDDVYVAHDDLDIPLGKFKIQLATGPKLHNGLSSIEEKLGTQNFLRIRIGVENRPQDNRIPGEAYVLQNFQKEESKVLSKTFPEIIKRLQMTKLLP